MTTHSEWNRAELRILRFLSKGHAELREGAARGQFLLDGGERGVVGADASIIKRLEGRENLQRKGAIIELTRAGRSTLRKAEYSRDLLRAREQERDDTVIPGPEGCMKVTVNLAESPLALLYRRKGKNGRPFLTADEFRAGERLRADYTRGQIMARLGVNWERVGGAGESGGRVRGVLELTEAALAARLRVEKAIEAVGPELAGVLVDICCFLKGMEQVETERGWPARSAKLMLKSALGALARHYEPPERGARGRQGPAILHWGAPDYRPTIQGSS